jgi:hypothetical protein
MIFDHDNALIFQRKFFLTLLEIRTMSRQIFSLLISKKNLRDSNSTTFQHLSTTIGRFFALSIAERILRQDEKRPSAPIARTANALHWLLLNTIWTERRRGRQGADRQASRMRQPAPARAGTKWRTWSEAEGCRPPRRA